MSPWLKAEDRFTIIGKCEFLKKCPRIPLNAPLNPLFSSFGTDCPEEAQRRAEAKGLKCEWGKDGYLKTKFTVSGFEYFPQLDRNLLYSAIADHGSWFDTWPGMQELNYMADYPNAHDGERPLAITYGDGSEFTREGTFWY